MNNYIQNTILILLLLFILLCSFLGLSLAKSAFLPEPIEPFSLTFNDESLKKELLDKINKTGNLSYGSNFSDEYSIISRQDNIKDQQARYTIVDIVLNDKLCPPMLVSLKDNNITVEVPFFKKIDFSKSFITECAILVINHSTTEMKSTSEFYANLQSWKN